MRFNDTKKLPDLGNIHEVYGNIKLISDELEGEIGISIFSWQKLVEMLSGVDVTQEEHDIHQLKATHNMLKDVMAGLIQGGLIKYMFSRSVEDGRSIFYNYYTLAFGEVLDDSETDWKNHFIDDNSELDCQRLVKFIGIKIGRNYYLPSIYEMVKDMGISTVLLTDFIVPELCKAGYLQVSIDDSGENEPVPVFRLASLT